MKYLKNILAVLGICFVGVALTELATVPEPVPCEGHVYVSWQRTHDSYNFNGTRQFYSFCEECGNKEKGRK